MSTVPSPTTKDRPPGTAGTATASASVFTDAGVRLPRRRRWIPATSALGAAAAAVAYGHFVLGMHLGPPLVMVGFGGLTLALSALALWRIVEPLTRPDSSGPSGERAREIQAPHRIRALEREKQTVLKAIKEIELDFQMRKISEVDYREMVERYRARALRIMGDLAVGDDYRQLIERELKARLGARAAAGAADSKSPIARGAGDEARDETRDDAGIAGSQVCEECGVSNDSDAKFCKRCGKNLTALGAAP